MKRRRRTLCGTRRFCASSVLVVAVLLLVAMAPAASARERAVGARADVAFWSATPHELRLRGSVETLAADGNRVAFSSCWWTGAVWQPGHDPHFFGGLPAGDACTNPRPSFGGFSSFAVAGGRVAYLLRGGGIGVFGDLFSASVRDGYQLHNAASFARCCAGDPVGSERWGDLVGGGDTIAYATWDFCGMYACDGSPVRVTTETTSHVDDTCDASTATPCPRIASSADALVPLAAARGRVLLRRADGVLELRSPAGSLRRMFRVGTPLDAGLAGRLLVVLVPGALHVIDTRTGHVLHRWPVRAVPLGGVCTELPYQCPSPELEFAGTAKGLAAYIADGVLHVVRLADGLDAVIARGAQARITSAGLFYAYSGRDPWPGRVRFVPRAQLFRRQMLPGSPAPPPRTDLFSQTPLQLTGPFPDSRAGSSIAAAGDVNGDGRPDVVVGAEGASPEGRSRAGSAFVVFGRRKPGVAQLAKPGGGGFEIDGPAAQAFAGGAVAGVGDVNGDGLADVAVTEYPRGSFYPAYGHARVVVVFGSRHPRSIDLAAGGAGAFSINGLATANVASAGDVNGDHLADILVCCTQTGSSAVVFGTRTPEDVDVSALGARGFLIGGATASSLAGVGDINGDGLADVALADPFDSQHVWVVYGKRATASVDLDRLGAGGFTIDGPYVGVGLAGVGDVNGDGLADLAVSMGIDRGDVAVVFGSRSAHPLDVSALGADGFTIENAGYPLGPAGDFNRDGLADLAVHSNNVTSIVFGQRNSSPVDVRAARFHGFTVAGASGPATAVGDMNGDGRPDLLLASPGASNAGPGTGTLYLFRRDTRPPRLRLHAFAGTHRVTVTAACSEPCTVSASAERVSTPRVYLARPGRRAVLHLDSTARVVTVRAVDDPGNASSRRLVIKS